MSPQAMCVPALTVTEYKDSLQNKVSDQLECPKNMKTVYLDENYVVLNEDSVEGKQCINREIQSDQLTIQLYSCHDINMKLPAVVIPPSFYYGCSTWKTFCEENFTGKEKFVSVYKHESLWSSKSQ